jgi:hypothetical protein
MMLTRPFLESAKKDERQELLRKLANALAPKHRNSINADEEQPTRQKSAKQE